MRNLAYLLLLSISIILVGLILYFTHFSRSLSTYVSDWADFSTFNSYFLSVVTLIILGYISFLTFRTTHTFNRLQIKPLLFITLEKPEQITGVFKDSWYVNNGAKNAALNLLVRYTTNRQSDPFTKWVSCTSLAENRKLELFWIHWADKIEISFSDLTGDRFYLFEFMDYYGHTREIPRSVYTTYLQEASDNRSNNMTHLRDKLEKYISDEKEKMNDPMKDYINNFISLIS